MAKEPSGAKGEGSLRRDPKANKSLAIRMVLQSHPGIAPKDAAPLVKKQYGHAVDPKLISIVKSKIGSRKVAERAKATPRAAVQRSIWMPCRPASCLFGKPAVLCRLAICWAFSNP